jgi:hypothetical protein
MFCKEKMYDSKILHDQENRTHYVDSLFPMTNLRGSHKKMAEFAQKCYDSEIQFFDFSEIMRKAHSDKQMQEGYREHETSKIPYMAVGAVIPANFEKEFLSGLELFGS